MTEFSKKLWTARARADAEAVAKWYEHMSGDGYAPGSIVNYATKLRSLYKWTLRKGGVGKREAAMRAADLFDEVPFKQLGREADRRNKLRDKLVTPEEYGALMGAADHPRLRALLATLYESAARPGEVLGLRLRDVEFRERYAQIRVSGKTGERTIPLVRAIPYLRAWLQVHPDRNNESTPLFLTSYHGRPKPLGSAGLQMAFKRLKRKAGIERRLYPYMFRHTRLTELADKDLGEFKMKVLAGWTPNSRMAARYIHLSGRSSLAPILEIEGVEVPPEAQPRPSPIQNQMCPRCSSENEGDALYCMRCGLTLDDRALHVEEKTVATTDSLMDALMKSPKVRAAIEEAMRELLARGEADG